MRIDSAGKVLVPVTVSTGDYGGDPNTPLTATVRNTGSSNHRPLWVWNAEGNDQMRFHTQAGSTAGDITVSGSTVAYGTFTGVHNGQVLESEIIKGATVIITKCTLPDNQPKYELKYSTTKNDPNVLGVVGSEDKINNKTECILEDNPEAPDEYQIFALGDGALLVTDLEGDIDAGDYLSSSVRSGHAAKQDTNVLMNYTIAKSLVDVDWSEVEIDEDLGFKSKYIPCTYHCG